MKLETISIAQKLSSPHPFGLLVSRSQESVPNIMAVSWWTFVCNNPPMLACALGTKSLSCELVSDTNAFTLCLPDKSIAREAFLCGCATGRKVDKITEYSIALEQLDALYPPAVRNSQIAFLCRVNNRVTVGNHTLFIADIASIYCDDTKSHLVACDGYGRVE